MRVPMINKTAIAVSLAVGSNAVFLPSWAQEGSTILEEIVVTAQKREQSLSDVNLSITAFSGDAMDKLGFSNSVDIATQTPGLNIGTPVGEGNNPSLVLRGVGINDFNDNNESTVGLYIDEVYMGALAGQTFQLFDLNRVEVLRGPQGTLYGRNTTGGLIHFVSNDPTHDNDGYVSLNVGEYSLVEAEFAQSIGLGEKTAARIALTKKKHDGYVTNRIGPDANEADSFAYRLKLRSELGDNWSIGLSAHGGDSDTIAPQYQHQATDDFAGGSATDALGYADTDGDVFAGDYSREGRLKIDTNGQSLTLQGDIGDNMTFTSITAAENVEKFHQEDTDVGPVNAIEPTFAVEHEQISQEVRLNIESGNNNYTVGAFYYDADIVGFQDLDLQGLGDIFLATDYTQDVKSWAVFGQAEIAVLDALDFILGLRYTDEKKDFAYTQDVDASLLGAPPGFERVLDITDALDNDEVSGSIGLAWNMNDATKLYSTVSRGFKSGGFNVGFGTGDSYGSETLQSYEVGVKSDLGAGSRLSAAAFYYDYSDLQALAFNNETAASSISNASDATVQGVELEWVANFGEGWLVNAGFSLLDTEIESIATPVGVVTNRDLVLAPDFSANLLVRYTHELVGGSSLNFQIDGNYQGDHYFDVVNQPVSLQESYSVWNARMGWTSADDNMEFALWVKNLAEEEYKVYTFDFTGLLGFNQQFYGPPRWIGGSFKYSW